MQNYWQASKYFNKSLARAIKLQGTIYQIMIKWMADSALVLPCHLKKDEIERLAQGLG